MLNSVVPTFKRNLAGLQRYVDSIEAFLLRKHSRISKRARPKIEEFTDILTMPVEPGHDKGSCSLNHFDDTPLTVTRKGDNSFCFTVARKDREAFLGVFSELSRATEEYSRSSFEVRLLYINAAELIDQRL